MSEVYEFIKEVGAPIAFAFAACGLVYKLLQWHRAERKEWREEHSVERKEWNENIDKIQNRNIEAIEKLSAVIEQSNNRRRAND